MHHRNQGEARHLLRCLILTAMSDAVLADVEAEVLEHSVRVLGRLDSELWESTWTEIQSGALTAEEAFAAVPGDRRLRRFILREMSSIALADRKYLPEEQELMTKAAAAFELTAELERFIDWARRAQAVFDEGEALLD